MFLVLALVPTTFFADIVHPSAGVKRTKLRLVRCRARKSMTDRERMKDARLDNNLADVPRIPAPWDVPVLDPADAPRDLQT